MATALAVNGSARDRLRNMSDEELIKLVGDNEGAFSEIDRRYRKRLHLFANRILNNDTDAEDVAQEALTRVFYHSRSYSIAKAKFSSWVFRIADNLSLNVLRWRKNHPDMGYFVSLSNMEDDYLADTKILQPDEVYERKEEMERVMMFVMTLPRAQSSSLCMCIEGSTYEEIALGTGTIVGTVKSRINRGRREMRKIYGIKKTRQIRKSKHPK